MVVYERESVCVCMGERVWVGVYERECMVVFERESVWVCLRERVYGCVWERECMGGCV